MKSWKIYVGPNGEVDAVKIGFSWPAFIFVWAWALYKGMWKLALAFVAIPFLVTFVGGIFNEFLGVLLGSIASGFMPFYFGFKGNTTYENYLISKKYKFLKSVLAPNKDAAMLSVMNTALQEANA